MCLAHYFQITNLNDANGNEESRNHEVQKHSVSSIMNKTESYIDLDQGK